MKKIIATTALTLLFAAPASALTDEEVRELLEMSNSAAAMAVMGENFEGGEPMLAEMKFALGEMSAAERKAFFEADETTRQELIKAKKQLKDGDSPAETDAIGTQTN